ncbi:DUF6177 family protein [Streptomyces violens]|uniref:DUF6177 family protein n=1 Tax=Streptomyces violens TaxID=66377 RepID=UPI00316AE221
MNAPMWWTEVRASTAVEEAGHLAGAVAGRLTAVLGGTTWPPDAAHTDIVTVPAADAEAPSIVAGEDPLSVDVVTDRAAVVIQNRPIMAATSWFTDVLRAAAASGRELQVVTPPDTRLTLPARSLLDGLPARWVVRAPDGGYYDGRSGAVLHWHEGHFTPLHTSGNAAVADAYAACPDPNPQGERQLLLSLRTTHRADERLLLGGALEVAWEALTGAPPAGWSTAEPVNLPWAPRQLTELARTRAQKSAPTWLVTVGAADHPAIATLRITRTPAGVEEHVTLAVGYTAGRAPSLDVLPELAETLTTQHGLASMLIHLHTARADLTTPPRREALPIPVSFTLGSHAVRAVGRTVAEYAPAVHTTSLGPTTHPTLHYFLGDGTDPAAWKRLDELNEYLKGKGTPVRQADDGEAIQRS